MYVLEYKAMFFQTLHLSKGGSPYILNRAVYNIIPILLVKKIGIFLISEAVLFYITI